MKKEGDPNSRWLAGKRGRVVGRETIGRLMPSDLSMPEDSIGRMNELLDQGYGVVVLTNHITKRDPFQLLKDIFFKIPSLRKRKVIAPVGLHQQFPGLKPFAHQFGIELRNIVTSDTRKIPKYALRPQNEGLIEFTNEALDFLRTGKSALIFPQTGRRERLEEPEEHAIGTFLAQAKRKKVDKIAFLFAGIGMKGVTNYDVKKVGGLNPLKKYIVTVGPCLTREELLSRAGGDIRQVDQEVNNIIATLVPHTYLGDAYKKPGFSI